jgi:hypothetical protein
MPYVYRPRSKKAAEIDKLEPCTGLRITTHTSVPLLPPPAAVNAVSWLAVVAAGIGESSISYSS